MATTVARLEAVLSAHTGEFDSAMTRSEGRMQSVGKKAGIAGLAIAGGLAYGLDKSVKAAMAAQTSQVLLERSFTNAHMSAAKYEPQVKSLEAASRKLGFTEEDVHTSLGRLITATHDYGQAAKDLTVAQDVARFKGIGLADATKTITMAMAGSKRALSQLGIAISPVTAAIDAFKNAHTKATTTLNSAGVAVTKYTTDNVYMHSALGKAAEAQAKLQDKMATGQLIIQKTSEHLHGQADAYSKTASGGMEAMKAQLNFLEISMGTALLPILAKVAGALATGIEYFTKHATQAKIAAVAVGILAAALIAARAAQIAMNLAMISNPIGAVITAVALLAAGLIYLQVKYQGVTKAVDFLKDHLYILMAVPVIGWSAFAAAEIATHWQKIINTVQGVINAFRATFDFFKALPAEIGNAIESGMSSLKDKIESLFSWHRIVKWIKDALGFKSPSPYFMAIGHDIVDSMAKGVGDAAGILKDAVFVLAGNLPGAALGALGLGGTTKTPAQSGPGGTAGGGGGVHASPQAAQLFASAMLPAYGWGHEQFGPLVKLWNQESGWSWRAANPRGSSADTAGAYGIPQSHPPSKMAAAGGDWRDNAFTQIKWGLNYIKSTYGSPARAWAQDVAGGLKGYALGGIVPGALGAPQLAVVHGGERITPPGGGGGTYNFFFPGYMGDQGVVEAAVFDAMAAFQSRNGRPAYGSGF